MDGTCCSGTRTRDALQYVWLCVGHGENSPSGRCILSFRHHLLASSTPFLKTASKAVSWSFSDPPVDRRCSTLASSSRM